MTVTTTTLYDLCSSLIAAVIDYYDGSAVPAVADLPLRQYVSDGLPAYDGAQLTVHVVRTFSVDGTGNETQTFPIGPLVRRGAEFAITLLRESPVMADDGVDEVRVPDPTEIEASAEIVLGDAERLADAIVVAYRAGDLPGCSGVFYAGWQSYGPEGGLVGGAASVRLMLD